MMWTDSREANKRLKADQRFQITNRAKRTKLEFRAHKREEVPGSTSGFGFIPQIIAPYKKK